MFRDAELTDKVAFVTGGSRGIGRAIVRQLASEGADVTFCYRSDRDAAKSLEAECAEADHPVRAVALDVREADACREAVDALLERTDRIDVLVNNSGIVRDNLLVAFEDADVRDVLDTNVHGAFNMARAVVPAMMRQRSGNIINVSSISGTRGGRGQTNYAASKGAVDALTRALAVELAPRKIRVNAVAPGIIETEMSRKVRDLAGDEALDRILLRRYGRAEEVAWLVCFLASRYSAYINGQVIPVDGGFKMA